MTLIKSISGIRGTIGGRYGSNLTPLDIVECVTGYAFLLKENHAHPTVVTGRDARISGNLVSALSISTLQACGVDVIDLGLSTTPTVEMAVVKHQAQGGIIFTASHNPKQWNALKFLNEHGEFISAQTGEKILKSITTKDWQYSDVDNLGSYREDNEAINHHIDAILGLSYIDTANIKSKNYHVVVDCINSTGTMSIPPLLDALGCTYTLINAEMTGDFAHNPEPLSKHLVDLCQTVVKEKAALGIAVDPDVDRLALVDENGNLIGEEYTLVLAADYLLPIIGGNTVSNLSSTRALADIAQSHGAGYYASAVGEVNVVNTMKANQAKIGGEGNGGVILADLHYGRDSLVGIAICLSKLASSGLTLSQIRNSYPDYTIVKNKIQLTPEINVDLIISRLAEAYKDEKLNTIDGLKIDFNEGWVHLRKSNTEPIIRVYAESKNAESAKLLASKIMKHAEDIINQ